MKVIIPESLSTEEIKNLASVLEDDSKYENPDVLAEVLKVVSHFSNPDVYSPQVQESLEEIFCTGKYSVIDMCMYVRRLARKQIRIPLSTYPLFKDVVLGLGGFARTARELRGHGQ